MLTRQGKLDKTKGDEYEDLAISSFIPQLTDSDNTLTRETTLATAVILRMAEQFSEVQDDARYHLVGASTLFTTLNGSISTSASFWLYMRQSIRAAFLNEDPCNLDVAPLNIEFTPVSEAAWTNRITVLLARICSACWNKSMNNMAQQKQLDELYPLLDLWSQKVPEEFRPWCEYRAEMEPFPVICYTSPWHGQYASTLPTHLFHLRLRSS